MADKIYVHPRILLRAFSFLLAWIFAFSAINIDGLGDPDANRTLSAFANLSGNYSDHGADVNQDGRFEFLTVEVGVDVRSPEEYSVMASLYDQDNNEVVWAIDHRKLELGYNRMQLDFDGKAIQSHGVSGSYQLRDVKLTIGNSEEGIGVIERVPVAYNTSFYSASDFVNPVRTDKLISGSGHGELLLTISIKKSLPVFLGKYSFDVVGINIPPITSGFNVESLKSLKGYAYDLEGIYIPGIPNNFTVSASGVKNINVGLKKIQGSYENSSMVWQGRYARIWVTTQVPADRNGVARVDSDLLSPGKYHAKIFGDAADNVSMVDLTMTMVKNIFLKGKFNLSINTTGFPAGDYSIAARALNGSISLDELAVDELSISS